MLIPNSAIFTVCGAELSCPIKSQSIFSQSTNGRERTQNAGNYRVNKAAINGDIVAAALIRSQCFNLFPHSSTLLIFLSVSPL